MATKKQQDAIKAKQKRQKVMAIGGAVLLLGLLAIQVPRTMKMMNAEAPPPPAPAAAPTAVPSDPSVLPTPGTAAGAAPAAAAAGTLIESDVAPSAATGQLVVFGQFESKDPFHQQIDPNAIPGGAAAGPAAGSTAPAPAPSSSSAPSSPTAPSPSAPATPQPTTGLGGGAVPAAPGPSQPAVPARSASIAVNGKEEVVARGGSFPKGAEMFTLVSVSKGAAKIAVAGGAFASGARTVTLAQGKAVTLVNTADGTRYELELVAAGA